MTGHYEDWEDQFHALYGNAFGHPLTNHGELSFCSIGEDGVWKTHLATVPMSSNAAEVAWKKIARTAKRGDSIYFGVGIRKRGTNGQGTAKDILAHSALGVDLDAATGDHKAGSEKYPADRPDFYDFTAAELDDWIAESKASAPKGGYKPPRATREEADGWTNEQFDLWVSRKCSLPLPTFAEITTMVDEMPVEPTLVTRTGGGLHVYVTFDEPIDVQSDPVGIRVRAGWVAHWIGAGRSARRHIDETPLKNAAGVLRVVSTSNHKYPDTIVEVDSYNEDGTFSFDALIEAFPIDETDAGTVEKITGSTKVTKVSESGDPTKSRHDVSPAPKPFQRFIDEMPLAEVGELVGIEWFGAACKIGWVDSDGEYEYSLTSTNGSVFVGEDDLMLKIWGPGTLAQWSALLNNDRSTFSAVDVLMVGLLRRGIAEKDVTSVAATLANRYRVIENDIASYPGLIDDLLDAETKKDVMTLIAEKKPGAAPVAPAPVEQTADVTIVAPDDASTAIVAGTDVMPRADWSIDEVYGVHLSTRPFLEAIANPSAVPDIYAVRQIVGQGVVYAKVSSNPNEHGLWVNLHSRNGVTLGRITDYVLYLDTIRAARQVTGMDEHEVTGKDYYIVSVLTAGGERHSTRPLPVTDSRTARTVLRELATHVLLDEPFSDAEVASVNAMIVTLGKLAMNREVVVNRIGWYKNDGRLGYVTPNGTLTLDPATGKPTIDKGIVAFRTALGSKLKMTLWQSQIGFDRIASPTELDEKLPEMVADFCAIFPKEARIGQSLLASFFLSFLPGGNRSATILIGVNGSMKSAVTRQLALLFSDSAQFRGLIQPFSVNIDKDSEAFSRSSSFFQGTSPNFAEDFLTSDNKHSSEFLQRLNILGELVTSAFSGAGAGRNEGVEESADRREITGTPFVTAESLDGAESRIERAITISLKKGDVDATMLDEFKEKWNHTGNGRALVAAFLAAAMADHESEIAIAKSVEDIRDGFREAFKDKPGTPRVSSNATQVLAGARMMERYAPNADWSESGAEWVTLNGATIESLTTFLRDDNDMRTKDVNPAERAVVEITDGIASGRYHLLSHDGQHPENADQYGWRFEGKEGFGEWKPKGVELGRISATGDKVFINKSGFTLVLKNIGITGRTPSEMRQKLAPLLHPNYDPDKPVSAKSDLTTLNGQKFVMRAWTFAADKIGLEPFEVKSETTTPEATSNTRRRSVNR